MHCFVCTLSAGELELKEHQTAKWLTKETLDSVEWLPADVEVAEQVRRIL